MTETTPNLAANTQLLKLMQGVFKHDTDILLISLSTTDGFNIKSYMQESISAEKDKIAALGSTLCALSNAAAKQILQKGFDITTIESDGGTLLFLNTRYHKAPCVLTLALKNRTSLATARYNAKRIATAISKNTRK